MYETEHNPKPGRELRRACRELCGPRTHPAPGHTSAEALRPWRGPVRIVTLVEQRTEEFARRMRELSARCRTGRISSCTEA